MLTRREGHVLVIMALAVLLLVITGIDQQTLNDHEYLGLFFFVLPIGLYIATDPERRKIS